MSHWLEPARDWSDQDLKWGLPTDHQIERLAQAIDQEHKRRRHVEGAIGGNVPAHRSIGLYGERHVARVFGLRMDLAIRPYGSRRKNIVLGDGTVIDVVTRQMLRNGDYPDLIRMVDSKGKVDTMILVVWHGKEYEPEIPGFISERDLVDLNRIQEFREGCPNYTAPVGLLHPICNLVWRHNKDNPYADCANEHMLTACRDEMPWEKEKHEPKPTTYQPRLFGEKT